MSSSYAVCCLKKNISYGVSFATTRSHQLARGAPACFLSGISFCFSLSLGPRVLHSFPTRRSSDLAQLLNNALTECLKRGRVNLLSQGRARATFSATSATLRRSEEHTSELQSHVKLVCRLLLEKKYQLRGQLRHDPIAPAG